MILFNLLALHFLLTVPHELGHFVAARLQGVRVTEFGIGLPPTIGAVRWRGTRWSLNLLPVGACVGYDSTGARTKSRWTASAILIGGSIANILVAVLCLAVLIVPESANLVDFGRNAGRHLAAGLSQPWGGDEIVSLSTITVPALGISLGHWMTLTDFLRLLLSASALVGFINLLPIPPLDGGRLVFGLAHAMGYRPHFERSVARAGFVGFSVLAFIGLILVFTTHA